MTPDEIAAEVYPDPYKGDTAGTLADVAEELQKHGVPDKVIAGCLHSVVGCIRNEYGD